MISKYLTDAPCKIQQRLGNIHSFCLQQQTSWLITSVADPWHFGVDPDPDPPIRIRDPSLWLLDPDPDLGSRSCYFRHWPSRCLLLFEGTFTSFSKIKSQKESQYSRNQRFSNYGQRGQPLVFIYPYVFFCFSVLAQISSHPSPFIL